MSKINFMYLELGFYNMCEVNQLFNAEMSGPPIPTSEPENNNKVSHTDQQNTAETSFFFSQFPIYFTQPEIENYCCR